MVWPQGGEDKQLGKRLGFVVTFQNMVELTTS
jgi:hypothetical protein